jgi:hypothetical protein
LDKELKILSGAILTMLIYGFTLLLEGKPFFIYPLNVMVNLVMTVTIIVSLKKYNWRNWLILASAITVLFHDPLFLSFFSIPVDIHENTYKVALLITVSLSNIFNFIAIFEKDRRRNLYVILSMIISVLSFVFFGLFGIFALTTLGLLLVLTSKNKEVEFLKVYWMFFVFMLLTHVIPTIIYQ